MSGQLPQVPNYLPNIQSPFAAAVQGLQVGQAFGEAASAEQQRASMQSAMQAFQRDPSSRTLTPLLTALPPQTAEQLRKHYEGMGAERRQETIGFGGQMFSLIMNGRTDLAKELATTRGTAARNSGDQANADLMDRVVQLVDVNPNAARDLLAVSLGATDDGKRIMESVFAARGAPTAERRAAAEATGAEATAGVAPETAAAEAAKKRAEIEKIYAEISDKQGEIPESARTIVNQTATEAWTARAGAQRAGDLAQRFSQRWTLGQAGRAFDAFRSLIGNTSEIAQLKQQYERELTSQVLASLPPGALSNAEQDQIRKGFPKATDSGESIAAYLRTVQKAYQMQEVFADIRGQWAAANGMTGPARRDFTIDGIEIPRGTTFLNFSRSYVELARDRLAAQEADRVMRSSGYGRVLQNPTPSQSSPNNGRVMPETGP
jgi:hypothetical protein